MGKQTLDAGEVGRIDVQTIYPQYLLYDHKYNSRKDRHSDEVIQQMAASIVEFGQLQPAIGRKVDGNKVQVVDGFCRCTAIAYINEHKLTPKPMKVLIRVTDMNAEEAFLRSVAANIERSTTTPVDDAHAQRRLREDFGWSESRIAELYRKSVSQISNLRKLLVLSTAQKAEVANGSLPVSAAILLTELPENERQSTLEAAKGDDGKVSTEVVKQKVRKVRQSNGVGGASLSMKEVRAFFGELTGPAESEGVRTLAKTMVKFISGEMSEFAAERIVRQVCAEQVTKEG